MLFRARIIRSTVEDITCMLALRRSTHALAIPAPINSAIEPLTLPPLVIPEYDSNNYEEAIRFRLPNGVCNGAMELMAVPRKKVSRHKRGIRNGPKALKPTPVIVRCMNCGRVKLPHFYCCSGRREDAGEK